MIPSPTGTAFHTQRSLLLPLSISFVGAYSYHTIHLGTQHAIDHRILGRKIIKYREIIRLSAGEICQRNIVISRLFTVLGTCGVAESSPSLPGLAL